MPCTYCRIICPQLSIWPTGNNHAQICIGEQRRSRKFAEDCTVVLRTCCRFLGGMRCICLSVCILFVCLFVYSFVCFCCSFISRGLFKYSFSFKCIKWGSSACTSIHCFFSFFLYIYCTSFSFLHIHVLFGCACVDRKHSSRAYFCARSCERPKARLLHHAGWHSSDRWW